MAGKNQVTLTFAGDSKSLEQSFDKVGAGAKKVEGNLDGLGKVVGTGGRQFGDYGKGLGGVGDRADEVDTRMMGLSDGIQGVTDLMGGNGKLAPHEMAMAFSDLGSAAYNTVIPSLQSAGEGVKKLAGRFSVAKVAAVGFGAAVAVGAVVALKAYNDAADEARGQDLAEEFERTGEAAEVFAAAAEGDMFALGDMATAFDALLEKSPVLAQAFLDRAEAHGLAADMVDKAQAAIDELADGEERLGTMIRDTSDAMHARLDPFFAVIDADRQHRDALVAITEAQTAATDAGKEFGEGSPEHVAALQAIDDAELSAAGSAMSQDAAISALAQTMLETGASVDDIIAHFQAMADEGRFPQAVVDELSESLRNVPGRVDTTITAHDQATRIIEAAGDAARVLDGSITDIFLQASWIGGGSAYAAFTGRTRAGGGIVEAEYFARGGMSSGPRGSDTVPSWLTPGEMVLNKGQQAELFAMANGRGGRGGGVTFNFYGPVAGEREFIRIVRDELQRGGFGGLGA